MTPVELVLSRLPDAKRNGSGWQARCPAHDDRKPSLSIAEGDDGRALLCCHAGCPNENIVAALGLTMADLMPDGPDGPDGPRPAKRQRKGKAKVFATARQAVAELEGGYGKRSATWTYTSAEGEPVGMAVRWDGSSGKTIRPVARIGAGWVIGAMRAPRPLYRLPELAAAQRVYVCEGEKAADAACTLGLTATTSPGGSKAPHKANWGPLRGKEVVILPDNDEPGRKYAEAVAGMLAKLKAASVVRIVNLPDLPTGGDIVEYLAARRAVGRDDEAIRAEIEALADAAEPVEAERPKPTVEPFQPFPVDALPEPVRGFVSVGAEAIGCDPSYIALPLLVAAASAIGNTRRIELKRVWTEPAILWGVIVGESGTLKSPALELATRPVRKRQNEAMREHRKVAERYKIEKTHYEKALAQWKRDRANSPPPEEPVAPVAARYWCDDVTVEALTALLREHWRGLLVVRDELAGWIGGFDRYTSGRGGDVAKWLELHGGRPVVVDRKTSDTLYAPRAAVSVAGGIQPATLRAALGREHFHNGLAARLLLTCPPRRPKRWTDADIPARTEAAVEAVFDRLYSLEPVLDEHGEPEPAIVRLTPEGLAAWVNFYNMHADEQAELVGDLAAAWSKLEGYAARLALVIHLVRWAAGDPTLRDVEAVDERSIAAGVELSRWFGHEARRVYSMLGESEEDQGRRQLAELIQQKGGAVTVRDLMRCSRAYKSAADSELALDELARAGFGRWEDVPPSGKGGRPTRRLVLADGVDVDETPAIPKEEVGFVGVNSANADDEDAAAAAARAAICEIDGGLPRDQAEKIAAEEIGL